MDTNTELKMTKCEDITKLISMNFDGTKAFPAKIYLDFELRHLYAGIRVIYENERLRSSGIPEPIQEFDIPFLSVDLTNQALDFIYPLAQQMVVYSQKAYKAYGYRKWGKYFCDCERWCDIKNYTFSLKSDFAHITAAQFCRDRHEIFKGFLSAPAPPRIDDPQKMVDDLNAGILDSEPYDKEYQCWLLARNRLLWEKNIFNKGLESGYIVRGVRTYVWDLFEQCGCNSIGMDE